MDTCSHVNEIERGKDYTYCENPGTVIIGGNRFCPFHAPAEPTD